MAGAINGPVASSGGSGGTNRIPPFGLPAPPDVADWSDATAYGTPGASFAASAWIEPGDGSLILKPAGASNKHYGQVIEVPAGDFAFAAVLNTIHPEANASSDAQAYLTFTDGTDTDADTICEVGMYGTAGPGGTQNYKSRTSTGWTGAKTDSDDMGRQERVMPIRVALVRDGTDLLGYIGDVLTFTWTVSADPGLIGVHFFGDAAGGTGLRLYGWDATWAGQP